MPRPVYALSFHLALLAAALAYHCDTDVHYGATLSMARKGLALDDDTFQHCASKIPWLWPNTKSQVSSIRLFKAWSPQWPTQVRRAAWESLVSFVEANNATVLLGTQITCDPEADDQDWEWTKELLNMFSPRHVMGVAIGNEIDLLHTKAKVEKSVTSECIEGLWDGGRFWSTFENRVTELDTMGFRHVPVTTVLTGASLADFPFIDTPQARVSSFLRNTSETYGHRFAYTLNFYPYFDGSFKLDEGTKQNCSVALSTAACFGGSCQVPQSANLTRQRIRNITGDSRSPFWMGETGWSSPMANSLNTAMTSCPEWSSDHVFRRFYQGFLEWEFDEGDELAPDHVFYFDIRDSSQFGVTESFGLVENCSTAVCKIRSPNFTHPGDFKAKKRELPWLALAWAVFGVCLLTALFCACITVRIRRANKLRGQPPIRLRRPSPRAPHPSRKSQNSTSHRTDPCQVDSSNADAADVV